MSNELIAKSMKCCALNLTVDGSEGGRIHYFKTSQPFENATAELRSQHEMLLEDDANPMFTRNDDEDTRNTDDN